MARGGGRLFEGGDYFKYFGQRGGDYSREAINRGTAIIRGNTVYFLLVTQTSCHADLISSYFSHGLFSVVLPG